MLDELTERDPKIKKIRAESEARGVAKGKAEGEAKGLQEAVVTVVEGRFPPLVDLAQQKVTQINRTDTLTVLLKTLTKAPDEDAARLLLELLAA